MSQRYNAQATFYIIASTQKKTSSAMHFTIVQLRRRLFILQSFNYLTTSTKKFLQSTATIEDQGILTYCSWLFIRKIHPQVEPLLASCCNRCSFFMIDIFTCQIFHTLQAAVFHISTRCHESVLV